LSGYLEDVGYWWPLQLFYGTFFRCPSLTDEI